jgi:hypothetical protein
VWRTCCGPVARQSTQRTTRRSTKHKALILKGQDLPEYT